MSRRRAMPTPRDRKSERKLTPKKMDQLRDLLNEQNISIVKANEDGLVKIRCGTCNHEETVVAHNLIRRKNFCSGCSPRSSYSTEETIQAIEKHGGKYIAGEVTDRDSIITLICCCGAHISKRAQDIRRTPAGCEICRRNTGRDTTLKANNNLQRAKEVAAERGGHCLSDGLISVLDKVHWQCSLGHRWHSVFSSVVNQGTWCPECNNSIAENICRVIMEKSLDAPFVKQRPSFLQKMELDGYNEDLRLAFECNGIQHYLFSPKYHKTHGDLIRQRSRDKNKQKKCIEHGITLISIPYLIIDAGVPAIRQFFNETFQRLGIIPKYDPRQVTIEPADIYDRRLQSDFVRFESAVKNKGGTFDPADFIGLSRSLPITCGDCNHTWSTVPWVILKGHWCPSCAGNIAKTTDAVSSALQPFGWSLFPAEGGYKNAHQKMPVACSQGHTHLRTWNDLQQQIKKGRLSCNVCNKEQTARDFIKTMAAKGFAMKTDIYAYRGEGQKIEGVCQRCSKTIALQAQQWKQRTLTPCCGERMDACKNSTV